MCTLWYTHTIPCGAGHTRKRSYLSTWRRAKIQNASTTGRGEINVKLVIELPKWGEPRLEFTRLPRLQLLSHYRIERFASRRISTALSATETTSSNKSNAHKGGQTQRKCRATTKRHNIVTRVELRDFNMVTVLSSTHIGDLRCNLQSYYVIPWGNMMVCVHSCVWWGDV